MARTRAMEKALEAMRIVPPLVSRMEAARILGVNPTNMRRFDERLEQWQVDVEGARAPAYLKAGVELVRDELAS